MSRLNYAVNHFIKNKDFRSGILVSKLVSAVSYETHGGAEKVDHTCIFYSMIDNKLEVLKAKVFELVKMY